jgi:hypothetical protein
MHHWITLYHYYYALLRRKGKQRLQVIVGYTLNCYWINSALCGFFTFGGFSCSGINQQRGMQAAIVT